jgi:phage tail fibre protein
VSNWSSYQFTRKGEQLRAKVEAGKCKLTLTKIKIGNGSVTLGDIKDMSDLKSPQLVLGISSCAVSAEDDRVCEVVGIASSSNVENAFSVTEMGLYANDPDVGEILYLVEIDTSPDDMPNKNAQSPVTLTYQIELVTSNTANVTAMVSPAGLVTVKMMSAHSTAAELDHPEKSVHKKHLHQDAYESPALTGTPTAPTAGHGTNNGQIASTAFVAQAIAALVNSAPGTLDTLQELAAALGNDANFAATITNALAGKVSKSGDTITGKIVFSNSDEVKKSIFPSHYYHNVFADNNRRTFVHAYSEANPPQYQTSYEIRISEGDGRFKAFVFSNDGLHTDLKGNADTASNAAKLGGQSLAWIVDQINTAKTGIVAGNLAPNGWVKFANGLIVQWGMGSEQLSEATQTVIFPITFSRGCFSLTTGTILSVAGIRNDSMWQVATVERERAVLFHQHFTTDGIGKTKPTYIAIGV